MTQLDPRAAFIGGGSLNFLETATLSGGSWEGNLPLTNLQHPDINTVARTTDAANASTQFKAVFGSARPVGGIVVGPSNTTPGSTWDARGYSDVGFTSLVYSTGTLTVPGATTDSLDYEWSDPEFWFGRDSSQEVFPFVYSHVIADEDRVAAATAIAWHIRFFDSANIDGFLQFGWGALARCFRPSVNYAPSDNSFSVEKIGEVSEAVSGGKIFWDRGLRRTWRATFAVLGKDEAFDEVGRMRRVLSNSRQFFVSPNPDDTNHVRDRSFIARFRSIPSIALSNIDLAATAFDCEEVL